MAFNMNTLKTLFSKLKPAAKAVAPVTDDVAKAVANYGDDALKAVDKIDDVVSPWDFSKSFDDYGPDDLLPIAINDYGQIIEHHPGGAKIDGKVFNYPTRYSPQNAFKKKLLDKRIGAATRPEALKISNISEYPNPDFTFPKTTSVLGDAVLEHSWKPNAYDDDILDHVGSSVQPYDVFNQSLEKPISTSGMVIQTPEVLNGIEHSDDGAFGLRPHRNTALGRWFAKNNPNYGWDIAHWPIHF
jgi:hypothetical protein